MNHPHETLWQRIDRFPPILIRLLARHPRGRPLSTAEISERSGLSPVQVEAISQSVTWDGIDIPTARKFLCACQIDLMNPAQMKRVTVYMRGKVTSRGRIPTPYRYLKTSPDWERYYRPLRDRWFAAVVRLQASLTTTPKGGAPCEGARVGNGPAASP